MASNYYDPWGPTDTGEEGMSPFEWEEYLRKKRELELLRRYAVEPTPPGELSPPEQTTVGETPEQRLERLRKPLPGLETTGWEGAGLASAIEPLEPMTELLGRAGQRSTAKLLRGFVAEPIGLAQRAGRAVGLLGEGPGPEEGPSPKEYQGWVSKVKQYAEGTATDLEQTAEKSRRERKFTNEWTEAGQNILEGLLTAPADVLPIMAAGKAKVGMGAYMALKAYAQGKSIPEALAEGGMGYLLGKGLRAGGELTGEYGPKVLRQLPETLKVLVPPAAGAYLFGGPVAAEQITAGKPLPEVLGATAESAAVGAALSPGGGRRPFEALTVPPISVEAYRAAKAAKMSDEAIRDFYKAPLPENVETLGPSPAEVEAAKYGEPTVTRPPEPPGPPTETPTAPKPPEAQRAVEPGSIIEEVRRIPEFDHNSYNYNALPVDPSIRVDPLENGKSLLVYKSGDKTLGYAEIHPSADGKGFHVDQADSYAPGIGEKLYERAARITGGPRRGGEGIVSKGKKGKTGGQEFNLGLSFKRPELVMRSELIGDVERMRQNAKDTGADTGLTDEQIRTSIERGGANVAPRRAGVGGEGRGPIAEEPGRVRTPVLREGAEAGPPSGRIPPREGIVRPQAPVGGEQLAPGDRVTYPNQITGKTEGGVVNAAGTLITLDGGGVRPISAAVAGGARRVAPPAAPEAPQAAAPRPEGYTAPTVTEAPLEAPRAAPAVPAPVPVVPGARPRARKPGPVVGPTETLLRELWDSGVKMPKRGESMWEELAGPGGKGGAIPPMMRRTGRGVRGQNYDMWLRRAVELGVLPEGADVSDLVRIARSPMSEAKRIDAQLRGERPDLTAQEQVEFDRAMEDAATRWTERFPEMGGKITKTGIGLQIQLKNGNKILVQENVPEIPVEAEAETKYREIHPEIAETTRLRAHGKTMRVGPNALIQIAKNAQDGTDVHEVTHVAYDMGVVTRAEDSVLGNKYAKEIADPVARQEAIANGVAVEATPKFLKRFTARVLSLGEMLQNAAARVGLAKEAVPSEQRVVTDVRTGRVLRRPGGGAVQAEKFAIKPDEEIVARRRLSDLLGYKSMTEDKNLPTLGMALRAHAERWRQAQARLVINTEKDPADLRELESAHKILDFFGFSAPNATNTEQWAYLTRKTVEIAHQIAVGGESVGKYSIKPEEEKRAAAIEGVEPEGAAAAREEYRAGERRRERGGFSEPTTTVESAGKVAAAAKAGIPRGGKPPEEYLNLSKITDEKSAQAAFEALIDAHPGRFESTSRPVTWEEVAKQSGLLTNSDVKRIVEEHGYVSAKIIVKSSEAARATAPVLIEAAQRLEKARLEGKDLDDAENNWLEVSQKSLGLLATAKEARTEAGRALNIAKRVSQGMTKRDVLLEHLLDKTADPRVIAELAKMDPNNPDPVLVHDILRAANKPLVTDMIQEAALSFMMSGIKTVERNLGGNSIFQALKLPVKAVSSALDAIYVGAKGGGTERQRYFAEIAKETRMLKDGLPQAWLEAVDAFQERGAVNWGRVEATHLPAIPGTIGKVIRVPLRTAGMGDTFFGSLASQQEIAAQAYRRAKNDVKAGKAKNLEARMAEILKHIEDYPQILRAAKKERAYRTFQEELGPFGQKVMGLLNHSFPLIGKLPRLIVAPFAKTPTNLFKVAVEHSPIGFAYSLLKTGLGGRVKGLKAYEDRGEVTDQMAKGIVGSMIAGVIYAMVKDGTITGMGPKDLKERANKMVPGWQPYAFHIADQFLGFQGWEPLSGMIMQVANFDQAINKKDKDKRLGEIFRAAKEVAINKTSAVGFQNLTLAVGDPERWGKRYLQSIAGMLVPTILSHVTQALDPYVRRRDTFWDVFRSRVPTLSEDLEKRYTVTGKEIKREQTPLEAIFAPYTRTTEKPAPLERELDRLGYVPVYAPRKVVINKKDYELTQDQMQFYVEADKKAAAEALKAIKMKYYQAAPEEPTPGMKTKQEILRDIWAHQRALARMKVVREVYRGGR